MDFENIASIEDLEDVEPIVEDQIKVDSET
jgi:hypothetical protein